MSVFLVLSESNIMPLSLSLAAPFHIIMSLIHVLPLSCLIPLILSLHLPSLKFLVLSYPIVTHWVFPTLHVHVHSPVFPNTLSLSLIISHNLYTYSLLSLSLLSLYYSIFLLHLKSFLCSPTLHPQSFPTTSVFPYTLVPPYPSQFFLHPSDCHYTP